MTIIGLIYVAMSTGMYFLLTKQLEKKDIKLVLGGRIAIAMFIAGVILAFADVFIDSF